MRWFREEKREGDLRLVKRFLLFPKTIGNETRWLETAYFEQVRVWGGYSSPGWYWQSKRWM